MSTEFYAIVGRTRAYDPVNREPDMLGILFFADEHYQEAYDTFSELHGDIKVSHGDAFLIHALTDDPVAPGDVPIVDFDTAICADTNHDFRAAWDDTMYTTPAVFESFVICAYVLAGGRVVDALAADPEPDEADDFDEYGEVDEADVDDLDTLEVDEYGMEVTAPLALKEAELEEAVSDDVLDDTDDDDDDDDDEPYDPFTDEDAVAEYRAEDDVD